MMEKEDGSKPISDNNINIQLSNNSMNGSKEIESFSFQDKEIEKLNKTYYIKQKNIISENNNIQNNNNENIIIKTNSNKRNIGRNFILFGKYIFGPLDTTWVLFSIMISGAVYWIFSIYYLSEFFSKYIFFSTVIFFILSEYYMFLTYITEPGIIPRNHPDFMSEEKEENKNENNEKNQQEIPRIYTERKCQTCNIIRPPKCSHCSSCDNCVLEFDHHCQFVSNCVGKRNHKYFFLFLLYGSILLLQLLILNTIVIIHVYIIKYNDVLHYILKGNKYLIYLIIICVILSMLFSRCIGGIMYSSFFITMAFCLFIFMWYQYVPRNDKTPAYYSPLINILYIFCLIFGCNIIGNLCGQLYVLSHKRTIKQDASIKAKIVELKQLNKDLKVSEDYNRKITCKEMMNNIIEFLFSNIDKSLIVPERDL